MWPILSAPVSTASHKQTQSFQVQHVLLLKALHCIFFCLRYYQEGSYAPFQLIHYLPSHGGKTNSEVLIKSEQPCEKETLHQSKSKLVRVCKIDCCVLWSFCLYICLLLTA